MRWCCSTRLSGWELANSKRTACVATLLAELYIIGCVSGHAIPIQRNNDTLYHNGL